MIERSFERLVKEFAERTATPGGGAAAALALSLGLSLGLMAVGFSIGRESKGEGSVDGEGPEGMLRAARDRLASWLDASLPMAKADCEAYESVSAAYRLPRDTDGAKEARKAAIQQGLVGAMEVPNRVLQAARDALELLASVSDHVNPNLASDLGTSACLLCAAADGAALNVRVNASSLEDRERAETALAEVEGTIEDLKASHKKVRDTAMAVIMS